MPAPRKTLKTLKPNLTRKPHTKTRSGCKTCKRRRIKCTEEKPECFRCLSKELKCEYPHGRNVEIASPPPRSTLTVSPVSPPPSAGFSMSDLRALHHFLTYGCPSLPVSNNRIWLRDIPQLAHQRPYLMHAILALGLSQLSDETKDEALGRQSLVHRGKAIAGLNGLLATDQWANIDIDAMLGTCYALVFQASHLLDGMADFLTFVRGCALITERIRREKLSTAFDISLSRYHDKFGSALNPDVGLTFDPIFINDGLQAFEKLQKHIVKPADKEFFIAVRSILIAFQDGPCTGFLTDLGLYGLWYHIAGEHLRLFTEPDNIVTLTTFMYYLTINIVLRALIPWSLWSQQLRRNPLGQPLIEYMEWIAAFDSVLSKPMGDLMSWPRKVLLNVPRELLQATSKLPGGIPLTVKEEHIRNATSRAHILIGDILRLAALNTAWFESLLQNHFETKEDTWQFNTLPLYGSPRIPSHASTQSYKQLKDRIMRYAETTENELHILNSDVQQICSYITPEAARDTWREKWYFFDEPKIET